MEDAHDLTVLIRSRIPLIVIENHDEAAVLQLLRRVARDLDRSLYRWSVSDGLESAAFGLRLEGEPEHTEPDAVLSHIKTRGQAGIYLLCDFHPWLDGQHRTIRLMKDIALANSDRGAITLVLASHALSLPPELARFGTTFRLSLPSDSEIMALVKEEARQWAAANGGKRVRATPEVLARLAANLRGLGRDEVRRLARGAIVDDGAITESDLPDVNHAKFQLMAMDGVLSYEYETEQFANVAGMDNLTHWLEVRRQAMTTGDDVAGLDPPRGILLLGVQGAGKSLAARAVAGFWGQPLLRFDMGALYNKYHGETERNLRESLALADRVAPCVLWIDEIEKGLGQDGSDGGLSQRVLGTLLTWMAERRSRVFLAATANDISRLPPELVRKGRFDEIFFVDLPEQETRERILDIHLRRRNLDAAAFPLAHLAAIAEGFSGAEIEQALVAALYSASAQGASLTPAMLEAELLRTTPLSQVMAERLDALRTWAGERGIRPA